MRTMTILAATAAMLVLCSCDGSPESLVHTGQNARDQAKEVVAVDAEQKIAMARQMLAVGKTGRCPEHPGSANHDPSKLPEATQEKLKQAMEELEREGLAY